MARVLEAFQALDRLVEVDRGAEDHVGLAAGVGRHVGGAVRAEVVGRLVDVVADVVDHAGEPIDVFPVERGDEGLVDQPDDL